MKQFSKTNILHIVPDLNIGGAQRMVLALLKQLDKEKYNVKVCYWLGEGELKDEIEKAGIEVIDLKVKNGSLLRVIFKLIKLIKENKIKLIHTHLFDTDLCGFLATRWAKVPIMIISIHSIFFLKKKKHALRYKIISLFIDRFLPVSDSLAQHFISWARINPNKVTAVSNGIDMSEFNKPKHTNRLNELRKSLGIPVATPILGTVARLEPRKGHRYLLEAVAQISKDYPDLTVLLVGDGELKSDLRNLVKELNISSNVIFAGSQENIPEILSLLDLFVLPTLEEGFSIAILEAMACGLPVIATNVGGVPELVKDKETGLLVASRSPLALASAMTMLLGNKEYAVALGEAGKKRVKQFSSKIMAEKIEEIYNYHINSKISKLENC